MALVRSIKILTSFTLDSKRLIAQVSEMYGDVGALDSFLRKEGFTFTLKIDWVKWAG